MNSSFTLVHNRNSPLTHLYRSYSPCTPFHRRDSPLYFNFLSRNIFQSVFINQNTSPPPSFKFPIYLISKSSEKYKYLYGNISSSIFSLYISWSCFLSHLNRMLLFPFNSITQNSKLQPSYLLPVSHRNCESPVDAKEDKLFGIIDILGWVRYQSSGLLMNRLEINQWT